jgi:hypothetical protein
MKSHSRPERERERPKIWESISVETAVSIAKAVLENEYLVIHFATSASKKRK